MHPFSARGERRGLLGLQLIFFLWNLIGALVFTVFTPLIMLRSGNDTGVMGASQAAFGIGGVVGGFVLSVWGGPKRKVDGVLLGMAGSGIFGLTFLGVAQNPILWMIGAFLTMVWVPLSNGSNQSIWQSKVPPRMQGRVFGTRAFIATISTPLSMAIARPLVDGFMTPSMMSGGFLVDSFGWLVGTGPGAEIGLLFVLVGLAVTVVSLCGYTVRAVREVEKTIPDHDCIQEESSDEA